MNLQMEKGNSWVVSDDLQEGELLLIEGLQKAKNGAIVQGREK